MLMLYNLSNSHIIDANRLRLMITGVPYFCESSFHLRLLSFHFRSDFLFSKPFQGCKTASVHATIKPFCLSYHVSVAQMRNPSVLHVLCAESFCLVELFTYLDAERSSCSKRR